MSKSRPISRKKSDEKIIIKEIKKWKDGVHVNKLHNILKKEMAKDTLIDRLDELEKSKIIESKYHGNVRLMSIKKIGKKTIVLKTKRSELQYEVDIAHITNHGFSSGELLNSDVLIRLEISNPTNQKIGVSRILVESKNPKEYVIAIRTVQPFVLEPQESKIIDLVDSGNVTIPIDKKFVEAEIQISGSNRDIIKVIPVKLYIGNSYDLRQRFD